MLEEPANDGPDANVLRVSSHTRPQAAESANDHIDRHACIRGLAQGFDHVRIFQLIHFRNDACRLPRSLILYLAMDQIQQPWPHGHRRDQDRTEIRLIGMPGKVVEQIHHIVRDPMVAGEQPDIGIEARSLHVIVAGSDMHVAT